MLGSALNLRTAVVVGGMDMMAQAIELGHRPHVVVATPGRIVDLLKSCSGEWDLSRIKFLVGHGRPFFASTLTYSGIGTGRSGSTAHPHLCARAVVSLRSTPEGATDMSLHGYSNPRSRNTRQRSTAPRQAQAVYPSHDRKVKHSIASQ